MRALAFAVIAAAQLTAGLAVAQVQRTLVLPAGPKFSITVPMGYSYKTDFDQEGNARVLMENPIWQIQIAAIAIADPDPAITSSEWQKNQLISRLAAALPLAKEKDYNFRPLNPRTGTGVYCQFSDAELTKDDKLNPGEFLHLTGGIRSWKGCWVHFQILSNDVSSEEFREVMDLFKSRFEKQ
jgi:hypothetical protein